MKFKVQFLFNSKLQVKKIKKVKKFKLINISVCELILEVRFFSEGY